MCDGTTFEVGRSQARYQNGGHDDMPQRGFFSRPAQPAESQARAPRAPARDISLDVRIEPGNSTLTITPNWSSGGPETDPWLRFVPFADFAGLFVFCVFERFQEKGVHQPETIRRGDWHGLVHSLGEKRTKSRRTRAGCPDRVREPDSSADCDVSAESDFEDFRGRYIRPASRRSAIRPVRCWRNLPGGLCPRAGQVRTRHLAAA